MLAPRSSRQLDHHAPQHTPGQSSITDSTHRRRPQLDHAQHPACHIDSADHVPDLTPHALDTVPAQVPAAAPHPTPAEMPHVPNRLCRQHTQHSRSSDWDMEPVELYNIPHRWRRRPAIPAQITSHHSLLPSGYHRPHPADATQNTAPRSTPSRPASCQGKPQRSASHRRSADALSDGCTAAPSQPHSPAPTPLLYSTSPPPFRSAHPSFYPDTSANPRSMPESTPAAQFTAASPQSSHTLRAPVCPSSTISALSAAVGAPPPRRFAPSTTKVIIIALRSSALNTTQTTSLPFTFVNYLSLRQPLSIVLHYTLPQAPLFSLPS